jgi:hypothetical protein
MEYDMYNPTDMNDYENSIVGKRAFNKELDFIKSNDVGYSKIYKWIPRSSDDKIVKKKIDFYTTGGVGSNIRDAETGNYYSSLVGSMEEDLYFKVSLVTGECKSKNKSNTLFFFSPSNYCSHMCSEVSNEIVAKWEQKRDKYLKTLSKE